MRHFTKISLLLLLASFALAVAARAQIRDEVDLYSEGERLLALKRYEEAMATFEEFIDRHPKDIRVGNAKFHIGECLEGLGKPKEALVVYLEVVSAYPNSAYASNAQLRIGHYYERRKDYDRALKEYQRILSDFPDTSAALAAKVFVDVIAGRQADAELALGESLYKAGDVERAVKQYRIVKEKYAHTIYADKAQEAILRIQGERYEVAQKYYADGDFKTAIASFTRFLEIFPDGDMADGARKNLKQAREIIEGIDMRNRYQEAFELFTKNDLEASLSKFKILASLYPKSTYGRRAAEKALEIEEMIRKEQEAAAKEQELYTAAIEAYQNGKVEAARDLFREVVRMNRPGEYLEDSKVKLAEVNNIIMNQNAKAQLDIAKIQYNGGDYIKARSTLKELLSVFPESIYVGEAEAMLQEVEEILSGRNARRLYEIGRQYFQEKQYQKAKETLQKLVNDYADNLYAADAQSLIQTIENIIMEEDAQKQYALATELLERNQYNRSIEEFKKFIELYPKSVLLGKATEGLHRARNMRRGNFWDWLFSTGRKLKGRIILVNRDGSYHIDIGEKHGVLRSDEFKVLDPDGNRVGTVIVKDVFRDTSQVQPIDEGEEKRKMRIEKGYFVELDHL
ncbi:MAG: tetratricopeptide repeat protein [bacterium]